MVLVQQRFGSLGVVTINLPRLAIKNQGNEEAFISELVEYVADSARINNAKRNIVRKRIDNGNSPLYSLGFMDIKKQYSTCGIIGLNEAVEIMGYNILSEEGQSFVIRILNAINETNEKFENQFQMPHNVEQIPRRINCSKASN